MWRVRVVGVVRMVRVVAVRRVAVRVVTMGRVAVRSVAMAQEASVRILAGVHLFELPGISLLQTTPTRGA